ncbi:hypothetical protein L0Y49_03450 [bacterium]|nr:hypothetical protein [bacterium]
MGEIDDHPSLVLHMRDIDTPEGKSVFLRRVYTLKRNNAYYHSHHLFDPAGMPNPFSELAEHGPLVNMYCCIHEHK